MMQNDSHPEFSLSPKELDYVRGRRTSLTVRDDLPVLDAKIVAEVKPTGEQADKAAQAGED